MRMQLAHVVLSLLYIAMSSLKGAGSLLKLAGRSVAGTEGWRTELRVEEERIEVRRAELSSHQEELCRLSARQVRS